MSERFSVCQFFDDGGCEYVRRSVPVEQAVEAFEHYTTSGAARIGMVVRVIITDDGDCIAAEWQREHGLTFPPPPEKKTA